MASDEIVWSAINHQFCSFKLKTTKEKTFCRNEHNVTGLCNRQSCPLANSRYATVRTNPETGIIYLYQKTIERSHMPSKLWEKTKLPANYAKALAMLDEKLIYWPKWLIHKCKQRLTRLTQVAIRTRRLQKEHERIGEKLVPKLAPKIRRREETRERKAESAAKVERAIERELIERLRSGAYGDAPLNVEENIWKKVLRGMEREGEGVRDQDLDDGVEEEEEDREVEYEREEQGSGNVEYVSDFDEEDDLGDLEDWLDGGNEEAASGREESDEEESGSSDEDSSDEEEGKKALTGSKRKRVAPPPKPKKKGPRMEIEYEQETTAPVRETLYA